MKKTIALIIIALLLTALAGCAGKTHETGTPDPSEPAAADTPAPDTAAPETTGQNGGVTIRSDAEGLVEVRIEDGKAELTFDLKKWDKLYDIYNIYNAMEIGNASFLREDPYEMKSSSGKRIKDVCIGLIEALNGFSYGFDDLTMILLLEDGTLE